MAHKTGERQSTWIEAAAVSSVAFLVYALGACPTIYVGDSGELVAAVYTLGIPHPTGYPLYVLLGKLWTLLVPVGSIAYRMSLFSAVCAAGACGLLYRLCRVLRLHRTAALLAASLLAFSPSFWSQANIQRVYSLNALFVVLATTVACAWYESRESRLLILAFFLCGLGATNHTYMAVYGVVLGVFALRVEPTLLRRPRMIAAVPGAATAGLLPYLYLPLRSLANPPLDWGNPETLHNFLDVVLRRNFWVRAWIEKPADLVPISADYLHSFGIEFAWVGALLALAGAFACVRRRWRPAALFAATAFANLALMALHGSRSDIFIWHRYYIPSYVMAALLAGIGWNAILDRIPRAAGALPLLIPSFLLITGWPRFNRSRYRIAETYSQGVLDSLPPGAHMIATDDNILFVLIYLTMVENRRPDVDLILQGVGGADLPPLHFNPETDPLFFTHHPNWNLPKLQIVPVGMVFRAWPADRPLPEPYIPLASLPGEQDPAVPKDHLTDNLIGYLHYMQGFTFENRDWVRARREFAKAAIASPRNDVLFYNLGLVFERNGLTDYALAAFARSNAINPRHLASQSRPRAAARLAELALAKQREQALEAELVAGDPVLKSMQPGSPAFHLRIAERLEARQEFLLARGHRLRALEQEADLPPVSFRGGG